MVKSVRDASILENHAHWLDWANIDGEYHANKHAVLIDREEAVPKGVEDKDAGATHLQPVDKLLPPEDAAEESSFHPPPARSESFKDPCDALIQGHQLGEP